MNSTLMDREGCSSSETRYTKYVTHAQGGLLITIAQVRSWAWNTTDHQESSLLISDRTLVHLMHQGMLRLYDTYYILFVIKHGAQIITLFPFIRTSQRLFAWSTSFLLFSISTSFCLRLKNHQTLFIHTRLVMIDNRQKVSVLQRMLIIHMVSESILNSSSLPLHW